MAHQLEAAYNLHLSTDGPVSAAMVIDSLQGLEGMAQQVSAVLSRMSGVKIQNTEVLISQISAGSLDENVFFRMIFGKGRAGERKLEEFRRFLGLKNMTPSKILAVLGCIAIGYVAWDKLIKSGSKDAAVTIQNSFNSYGAELGLSGEEIIALVEATTRPRELKKNVAKVVHPAGASGSKELKIDAGDGHVVVVPKETIDAVPVITNDRAEDDPFEDRDNVQMLVRAVDLDRPNQGWHAIVAEISERRLPIEVAANIQKDAIPVGKYVQVDVTVVFKQDHHGNKTPKRYLVRKLHPYTPPAGEIASAIGD